MGIINKIKNRIDKTWQPKVNQGTLQRHFDIDSIDMSTGDWLVLSRTRHMLNDIEESLYRQGLYYKNRYKRNDEQDLHEAATCMGKCLKGQPLSYKQVENISKYMSDKHWQRKK